MFSRICDNWYLWEYLAERDFSLPKYKFIVNDPDVKPVDRYLYIENLLSDIRKNINISITNDDVESLDILLIYNDNIIEYTRLLLWSD